VYFALAPKMVVINEEYVGLRVSFTTVHGGEDKVKPLNPDDDYSNE